RKRGRRATNEDDSRGPLVLHLPGLRGAEIARQSHLLASVPAHGLGPAACLAPRPPGGGSASAGRAPVTAGVTVESGRHRAPIAVGRFLGAARVSRPQSKTLDYVPRRHIVLSPRRLGRMLRTRREEKGLSQRELARRVEVDRSYLV